MALLDPRGLQRLRAHRGAMLGLALILTVSALALLAPWLAPHAPDEILGARIVGVDGLPEGPSRSLPLGADAVGRCLLSRLLFGARISLAVAAGATLVVAVVGVGVGVLAGYFGGVVDAVLMRSVDALMSFPFLLVVMALNRIIAHPRPWVIFAVLGGLAWPSMARQVRARTMQLRAMDFVAAARALGASHARVLGRHILPNLASLVIVIATTVIAEMIIAESVLTYLGVGVAPPTASWGSMLQESEPLTRLAPRLAVAPGLAILLTVFGFNLLGEGLRDALDPKA
ncbi:MAG: ABC transporter permease [Polyangiales bacterium]